MGRINQKVKRVDASIPTIRRLPAYLEVVKRYRREGKAVISGTVIADELELEAIQVRKDLAVTGIVGKPRVGYPTAGLAASIERFLGWDKNLKAIVVGAGNLGSALMNYAELRDHGLTMEAAFDTAMDRMGPRASGIIVYPMERLGDVVKEAGVELALLTVPPGRAQSAAEALTAAGIRQIWNFTNVRLRVPDDVLVLREDLSSGFAVLTVLREDSCV